MNIYAVVIHWVAVFASWSVLVLHKWNMVLIYNAGPCYRWNFDWGGAKVIRGWHTGLSSPCFWFLVIAHSIWATPRVRQGLDSLLWMVLFVTYFIFKSNDQWNSSTVWNLIISSVQVVALDVDLPVKQAFHILHEQVSIFSSQGIWLKMLSFLLFLQDGKKEILIYLFIQIFEVFGVDAVMTP